jgi:tetratricopeptide (TPR) repeat protein
MSWHDLGNSRPILDEVLALSERQSDPAQRDVTQMLAYVRRLWGFGWNRADAARCEAALKRVRARGDSLAIARAQISFSMVCMVSSRYREAHDLVDGSYQVFRDSLDDLVEVDLARAAWMRHIGVPWSLFSRGAFGAALNELDASIAIFEKEDDRSAVLSYQVYRGVLRFYAFDFDGVLRDCEPIASLSPESAAPSGWILPVNRRIALIFRGLAEVERGNHPKALAAFRVAEDEMQAQPVHLDWYWRLALEWGMVTLLIAMGDHAGALARAEGLCALAEQTDERAWQALAYEGQARAALARGDVPKAIDYVGKASAACAGVQIPSVELRVVATGATAFRAAGDAARATQHICRGEIIRKQLAESLPEDHSLRQQFERRSATLLAG